jgi:16S rRNA pseudouridine516 synthase
VQGCRQIESHRLEIVLVQGKYHQVKRMLAAAGNHCAALHRSAIGGLTLEALGLAEGDWCHLDAAQRAALSQGREDEGGGGILTG